MKRIIPSPLLFLSVLTAPMLVSAQGHHDTQLAQPVVPADVVFAGVDGVLAVEAEHFFEQKKDDVRRWYRTNVNAAPDVKPDGDEPHAATASNGAYVEILPDTRRSHGDRLIHNQNFTEAEGTMAVLSYKVHLDEPGRYYIWVRSHPTNTEDNGIHVGFDKQWPETGRRGQMGPKNQWAWTNKQRKKYRHTGVPWEHYLDIPEAGEHTIHFSMREDGFEFDKFVLAKSQDFQPEGTGPKPVVHAGELPAEAIHTVAEAASDSDPQMAATTAEATEPEARGPDGDGTVKIAGEMRPWHPVTLTLAGPYAKETDTEPNPFLDYRMTVRFVHASGAPEYFVPGYFAADGDAAETSADSGNQWRAHLSPDAPGTWNYTILFEEGDNVAIDDGVATTPVDPYHLIKGSFEVQESASEEPGFYAHGRLEYVGGHHLRFAGSGDYFLKAGADAPETALAFADFDGTYTTKPNRGKIKTWEPHLQDWRDGDVTWQDGKGKGLIGALNYLSEKGVNAWSFLTYNWMGDGGNVWPFVQHDNPLHYDVSKLDQWNLVFTHAQQQGIYLHFKTQEQEIDDERLRGGDRPVPAALDGGKTGTERKLYYRELIARFGHHLALNWNLGEENTQSTEEQIAMAEAVRAFDPYDHNVVIHTFPGWQARVYEPLLGETPFTGASLQNHWNRTHLRTLQWLRASAEAGKPWVVANDEQGGAGKGVPPDPGYPGFDESEMDYDLHDIRKQTLWGNLMAGGAGVEYYFGYSLPQNDLFAEDWRSRDRTWDFARIALDFFTENKVPFWEMSNANTLISNPDNEAAKYCLAKPGEIYVVYLGYTGETNLDLSDVEQGLRFQLRWFNPRTGEFAAMDRAPVLNGGTLVELVQPEGEPDDDWVALIERK
ncbi:MAG: DUF5060 domain-containing protein [Opitutales bacterium]